MKNTRLSSIVQNPLAQQSVRESIKHAVGELVHDEAQLQNEWIELTKRTPLAKTRLNIHITPAKQQCMWCFLVYRPAEKETTCPQCQSVGVKITSGEEFYLEED